MNILAWKHGETPDDVRRLMRERLQAAGISDKVTWDGNRFTSSVGWGTILNLVGRIEPEAIVLEKCSGAIGGVVLSKCREAFREMFPGGEEIQLTENSTRQGTAS